ncbi:YceD family protein [Legionella fallonii]|uniref:Large ribosomal RNA subunit accumulation protein YceD n=1 Tax=Legionella fallonii LLAP-10 TaxID=1212491 RepID=A0A098G5H9_9GAMM|nr:YceD family protein [Legionella fallonii]CEG56745.1 Metal-binding protein [Legionella fallonii LLAP-10]
MLHLPEIAKQGQQTKIIRIDDRLPSFLISPCQLNVTYHVEVEDDFYLLHLKVVGDLNAICQRCMQEFHFSYDNETTIAVCRSDERAEQVLELYECIVSSNWHVDLNDLITDELHLYAPQFHPNNNDCDSEINQILTQKDEPY